MRLISTIWTGWYKRVIPLSSLGFLGLFVLLMIPGLVRQELPAATLLIPLGIAAWGYILMRLLRIFTFADEVWLDGENLIVRNGGREDRLPMSQILSAKSSFWCNPERIVLTLGEPRLFGREVVFAPPFRLWRFTPHPLAEELNRRVRETREGNSP